jgi:hypothetical protein
MPEHQRRVRDRRAADQHPAHRHRDKDDLGAKPLDEFIEEITGEIAGRSL